jgi:hypothetical protein
MKKEKGQKVLAWPPRDYQWIEDMDDIDKLSTIYSKLEAISSYFSYFRDAKPSMPIQASDVYGYWFIIKDICNELAGILKVDYWTGGTGKKADEGEK